jgi:large subunit ribosomal protein L30
MSANSQVETPGESSSRTGSLLVVNLRGLVNTRTPVRTTLEQLSIARRFNATIVPDDATHRGMLNLAKDHVAWCKLDSDTAKKLLASRSEKSSGKRFQESDIVSKTYSSFPDLARGLETGELTMRAIGEIRPFFRLSPPKGGFKKSTRRQYGQGGILGPNDELPKIVEKML